MKAFITALAIITGSLAFGYQDLLQLVRLAEDVKSAKASIEQASAKVTIEQAEIVKDVITYNTADALADLKLWHLEYSQPKIFIDIETADNATDIGYLRTDYRKAGNIGKLGLLKEYFNIK